MKIDITKSPIPILWLDTWFLLDLARALNSDSTERKVWAQNTVNKVIALTKQKKILCPQADQGMEIELSNNQKLVETAQRLQTQMSVGISMHFHAAVENLQIQRMMKAVIQKQTQVTFPWEDIFMDDIIREIESKEPWLITVHSRPKPHMIAKQIKTNKSIATAWEKLRKKARKIKQTYEQTLERESKGKSEAMVHVMAHLAAKTLHKKRIFVADLLRADELIGKPLAWWERHSGKQDVLNDVLRFYRSEEYMQIPTVNIGCRLLSELASGNEAVSPSDVMDIHHVETVFPYATYMVVDKRIRNRIERIKLDKEYSCKLLKWQETLPLLEKL